MPLHTECKEAISSTAHAKPIFAYQSLHVHDINSIPVCLTGSHIDAQQSDARLSDNTQQTAKEEIVLYVQANHLVLHEVRNVI